MNTIENQTDSEPEPEPEPGVQVELEPVPIVKLPNFESYEDEALPNNQLNRVILARDGAHWHRIFFISEQSSQNPGEVHVDTDGAHVGRLNDADKQALIKRVGGVNPVP